MNFVNDCWHFDSWVLVSLFANQELGLYCSVQSKRMLQRIPQFYTTKKVFGETIRRDALLLWLTGFCFIK